MNTILEDKLDKLLHKLARGILLRQEVVDFAFADLAYEGRFDLIISLTKRLLQEGFKNEIRSWADWGEERSNNNSHYFPFNDSRLVIYHFGNPYESTPEEQEEFRAELKSRVKFIANMVRTKLNDFDLGVGGNFNS